MDEPVKTDVVIKIMADDQHGVLRVSAGAHAGLGRYCVVRGRLEDAAELLGKLHQDLLLVIAGKAPDNFWVSDESEAASDADKA